MMCANYGNLEKEVKELDEGGIDSFHIDIMDGRYVPNFAMSLNDMRYIASAASKPLDVFCKTYGKVIPYTFTQRRNTTRLPPCKR